MLKTRGFHPSETDKLGHIYMECKVDRRKSADQVKPPRRVSVHSRVI